MKRTRRKRNNTSCNRGIVTVFGIAALTVAIILTLGFRLHIVQRYLLSVRERSLDNHYVDHLKGVPYSAPRYNGIDVSHNNGYILWDSVAKDPRIEFVYIKASQGSKTLDERYGQNVRGAQRHNIAVGAYHYFTTAPVSAQLDNFTRQLDRFDLDLRPVVDIEHDDFEQWTDSQLQDSLLLFVKLLEDRYGCSPIVYSYHDFYQHRLSPHFRPRLLWIARYNGQTQSAGDYPCQLRQYTQHGHIRGIGEYVDLNRFVGSTTLKALHRNR